MAGIHDAWPFLVPLAAALVTCVLGTLTRYQAHEQATHDLLRETRQRRADYIASVDARIAAQSNADRPPA